MHIGGDLADDFADEQRSSVRHVDGLALPAGNDRRPVSAEPRDDCSNGHRRNVGELTTADRLD